MRSREIVSCLLLAAAAAGCTSAPAGGGAAGRSAARPQAFGQPISETALRAWDIDVRTPDGRGLPPGSGTIAMGKTVYADKCASCHGADAKGGSMFGTMVGGIGSFTTNTRVLTPGSMYPYPAVLFDYVRRAMPLTAPQSLTDDEVYAVSGYLLHLNGLMPADATVDARSLAAVRMPNRDGFIADDRPDTKATRCMTNCPPISPGR